jgi:hypothetical protein
MANEMESTIEPIKSQALEIIDPQEDMFGPVAHELSLQDVRRSIRGVSRPRDLRPLIQKSSHDPLMNMLELAMKAKAEGNDSLAFNRFAECLPYVWTRITMGAMQIDGGGPSGAGEVTYRWASGNEA